MGVKGTNKGNKSTFWDFENTSGKRKYKNTHALGYGWETPASATGGTVVVEGLYSIHHFPNPSYTDNAEATFSITNKPEGLTVDYIVIGGGGSGGSADPGAYSAGGGGAGTVHVRTGHPIANDTSYPVIIGKGGTNLAPTPPAAPAGSEGWNPYGKGQPGFASTCFGLTAPGGGAGGATGSAGDPGGSSGGASHGTTTVTPNTGDDWPGAAPLVSPTNGWGNVCHAGAASFQGGGGGGAASGGPPASRAGGAGIDLSPMVGTTFGGNPAAGNNTASGGYFAGGGGAGYYGGPTANGGSGGGGPSGGPGAGSGARAVASTGSGGGGADGATASHNPWNPTDQPNGTFGTGGGGAPGIVIIRYLTADL